MIHDIEDVKQINWGDVNEGDTLNIVKDQTHTLYIQDSNIIIEGNGFLFSGNNWGITAEPEFANTTIRDVRVTQAIKDGIRVSGTLTGCETFYCGTGIQLRGGGTIDKCKSFDNQLNGITGTAGDTTIINSETHGNLASGIEIGRWTSTPDDEPWIVPTVHGCRSYGNALHGINAHYKVNNGLIDNNWVDGNGGGGGSDGIHVGGSEAVGSGRFIIVADNYVAHQKQVNADGAGILLDDMSYGCISSNNELVANEECGVKFHNCDYPRSLNDRVIGSVHHKLSRPRNAIVI